MLLLFFIVILAVGIVWWYKYRWNIPLLQPKPTPTLNTQANVTAIAIISSSSQMSASDNFASGVELTIELRDSNGGKVKADGSRIITLSSDVPGASFEAGEAVTINDGDYDTTTRYKSTKAGAATLTAATGDIRPATTKILIVAGPAAGLSPIGLHGSADVHELKSQTEYSFEANIVDSFGNIVEQPGTVNWQALSDPTTYPIKTDAKGKSIFNYVFDGDGVRTETIRAGTSLGHQDYPVTVTP